MSTGKMTQRTPCKPGTEIDYCGMHAVVVHDDGGERVRVRCEGHEQNWAWRFEDVECTVTRTPKGEFFYESFDAYVGDFPDGERFRAWVTSRGTPDTVFLVKLTQGGSMHGGLPGDYMWCSLSTYGERILLSGHDCDDGLIQRTLSTEEMAVALQVVENMKSLAPLSMADAVDMFGFSWQ